MTEAAALRVLDFDGLSMTGTEFEGCFLVDFDITSQFPLEAVLSEAPADFPTFIRGDPQDKVIPLHVTIVNPTMALIDTLKAVFSPFRDPVYLRVEDDDGNTRRMLVKSLGLTPWETHTGAYVASLEAAEPIWESDAENSDEQLMTGTVSYPFTLNNAGNVRTFPTFRFEPQAVKGNANHWIRRYPITIGWRSSLEGVDTQGLGYPIDITNRSFDSQAEIAAGRLRADGEDLRVFVDGIEVDRFIDDLDMTDTAVWCGISFQPARIATLETSMAPGVPADGGSITVNNPEGTIGFPNQGVLIIDDEAISYESKREFDFDFITRSQRGTANAAHTPGTPIYWVEHDIVMVTNYTAGSFTAGGFPESPDREPIIDKALSSNGRHVYSTADGFIAPTTLKPGQWLRELRGTNVGAASTNFAQDSGEAVVTDQAPLAGAPNFDALALYTPCLVDFLSGVDMDYEVGHDMLFEVFGADDEGFESRILRDDVMGASSSHIGAPTYLTGQNVVAAAPLSRLTLHGRNYRHTGTIKGAQGFTVGNSANQEGQSFTLVAAVLVQAVHFQATRVGGGADRNIQVAIFSLDGATGPVVALTVAVVVSLAGGPGQVTYRVESDNDIILPAGKYVVVFTESGGSVGTVQVLGRQTAPFYSGGNRWQEIASVWTEQPEDDISLVICGEDASNQPDAAFGLLNEVRWRNLEVPFTIPPTVVLGANQQLYLMDATLQNATTGQILTILVPVRLVADGSLIIDTSAHLVQTREKTGDRLEDAQGAVEPDDLIEWLRLDPGLNTLWYVEATVGAGIMELTTTWRDRWT